jgi:hypothetical protein
MDAIRERIRKIAELEFPSSKVVFDEDAGGFVSLKIELPNGLELTRAHPDFYPSEIANRSDEELRKLIRALCGHSEPI